MSLDAILRFASQTPERPALIFHDATLSYARFARAVQTTQRLLVDQGVAGDGIAILGARNLMDAWVAGLALRGLGLTTISLRLDSELGGLALRDLAVCVTSTAEPQSAAAMAAAGVKVVSLPPTAELDDRGPAPTVAGPAGGHIMLTSGTTGTAKKILFSPENQADDSARRAQVFDYSERSVVNVSNFGLWTSVGFNVPPSVWAVGGAVVIDQRSDPRLAFLTDGLTHATVTPVMLQDLLARETGAIPFREGLRLFVGGGPLPKALAAEALARLTGRLFTYAAATEVGPFSLTPVERLDELHWHRLVKPDDVTIVDEAGAPVAAGQVGLIRVRTNGVSGYLDDEAASRAFFRDGAFQSGDLAVFNPDGRLALIGRVTDVINVLGDKIATGPIEQALQDRLGAEGVCVFSMPGEGGAEELHVALQIARRISRDELAAAARAELRGFPAARFHLVDALPRNDMGKIQRLELRRQLEARGLI